MAHGIVDPVAAYDCVAADISRLAEQRRPYLNQVENQIVFHIPPGSASLLDVGAGDGSRAARIAMAAHLDSVVLLEPSSEMRKLWSRRMQGWAIPAEQLREKNGAFDVITCLWNVLGHIFPAQARVEVLQQCRRLLSPRGLMFVDVNHRYNLRAYGAIPTLCRMLRDLALPSDTNGDVQLRWITNGRACTTRGHVFTHSEFRRLANRAGLEIQKIHTIDYSSGELRESRFDGNPLFVLRRPGSSTFLNQ